MLLGSVVLYSTFEVPSYFFLIDGLIILIDVVRVEPAHSLFLKVFVSNRLVIAISRDLGRYIVFILLDIIDFLLFLTSHGLLRLDSLVIHDIIVNHCCRTEDLRTSQVLRGLLELM